MDRYSDRIPVRTEGSATRYDGRVWYKHLNTIKSVNGVIVVRLKPIEKSDLKHGDRVRVDYEGKIFSGVIDLETESTPLTPERKMPGSPHPPSTSRQLGDEEIQEYPGSPCLGSTPRKQKSTAMPRLAQELELPAPKKPWIKPLQKGRLVSICTCAL